MKNLFEKLSPPPGGLEGLRRKLAVRETRSHFHGVLKPAGLVTVLILMIIGYRLIPLQPPSSAPDYGIFQRYMGNPPPRQGVSLVETEGSRLRLVQQATDNPAVELYWIEEDNDQ